MQVYPYTTRSSSSALETSLRRRYSILGHAEALLSSNLCGPEICLLPYQGFGVGPSIKHDQGRKLEYVYQVESSLSAKCHRKTVNVLGVYLHSNRAISSLFQAYSHFFSLVLLAAVARLSFKLRLLRPFSASILYWLGCRNVAESQPIW